MNRSQKRPLVFATRVFPPGCGTARQDHTIAAREPTSVKRRSAARDRVIRDATSRASSSSRRQNPEIRNSGADARQKVCEVRSLFKQIYRQLDQDKQARRGGDDVGEATRRIDLETQNVIESMGKQINTEKRIGSVPGIKVGDEFQYKSELRIVGLHSKPRCGIDYMKIGEVKLATSIVSSEGYGYNDNFKSGMLIYTGEGGNVVSKEDKTKDQKLEKGNLALANSKEEKSVVRVILGEDRWDRKGKRYIYDGLYTVEEYWREREDRGKLIYKFKLFRIPGQPPSTWNQFLSTKKSSAAYDH